jgi:glycosyltransferase involved in cell wall biosynthesis
MMQIHVSAADRYPLRFVDVVELFFGELARKGVSQTWYVQGVGETRGVRTEYRQGVRIIVSPVVKPGGLLGKLLSKVAYWLLDTVLLLRLLWRPVDLIIVRDKYWASLVGLVVARVRRTPFVVWMSYPFPEDDLERSSTFPQPMRSFLKISGHFGRFAYYGIAMKQADHCFVQSERMKLEMHERGIPLDRMTAVPMGISAELLAKGEQPVAVEMPPVVLYVGGLQVVRRLDMLIESFAEVAARRTDVQFRVVGDGSVPEDRARLERRAQELGIAQRVEFTGQVPMAEAQRQIATASVCLSPIVVTPTLRVASPTKFVEYLAWSKPTIGNDHPEQSMIAEQSGGAICVEWSATAFADAIIWCLDNPAESFAMAARGRAWVKANRTYDTIAGTVYERLNAIVAAGKA